jgi:DNA-binding transcriptional regulator YhcF (GntR family)
MSILKSQKKTPSFEALAQEYDLNIETIKGLYDTFVKN